MESIARENIVNLLLEVLDLTKSADPRAWELVAIKFDAEAETARRVERHLDRRAAVEARENELDAFLGSLPGSHPLQAPQAEGPRVVYFPFPGSATGASFPNFFKIGGRR